VLTRRVLLFRIDENKPKTKGYFCYMKERFINSLRFRNGMRE
jgi:hypothetical protein